MRRACTARRLVETSRKGDGRSINTPESTTPPDSRRTADGLPVNTDLSLPQCRCIALTGVVLHGFVRISAGRLSRVSPCHLLAVDQQCSLFFVCRCCCVPGDHPCTVLPCSMHNGSRRGDHRPLRCAWRAAHTVTFIACAFITCYCPSSAYPPSLAPSLSSTGMLCSLRAAAQAGYTAPRSSDRYM